MLEILHIVRYCQDSDDRGGRSAARSGIQGRISTGAAAHAGSDNVERHRRSTQALDRSRIERSFGVATGTAGRWRAKQRGSSRCGWRSTTSCASPTSTRGPHRHGGRDARARRAVRRGLRRDQPALQAQPRARRRASGGGEFVRDAGRARAGDPGAARGGVKLDAALVRHIWTAVALYVLVAIVKKELHLEASPYTLLQILSVTLFEKLSLQQALGIDPLAPAEPDNSNQLVLQGF